MKILLIHNRYQQPGGEDTAVEQEAALLRKNGCTVIEYERTNDEISEFGWWGKVTLPRRMIWASDSFQAVSRLIQAEKPDIVHVHNTLLMLSPAVYYACSAHGLPVVQTLHNYRLSCCNALFLRNEEVCELCLGRQFPWPGVMHRCYRDSRMQTAALASMVTFHRWLGTWRNKIHTYIALTEFARQKFIQMGLPAEKLALKPNFVYPDPGPGTGSGGYALFVGRLSREKGLDTLLTAWKKLGDRFPLKIVGDGPLVSLVQEQAERTPGIEWMGRRSKNEVLNMMQEAAFLIIPSIWYENFPFVIAEAYATGLPVIGSQIGSLSSLIDSGRTGLHFKPGDPQDLEEKVNWLLAHPAEWQPMRQAARAEFEAHYTAGRNYTKLIEIYQRTIENGER